MANQHNCGRIDRISKHPQQTSSSSETASSDSSTEESSNRHKAIEAQSPLCQKKKKLI
ncbi:hypothetical protein KSP40_PGU016444 [Platanthera guangdongensis]|uniref:Uncharacterized protein n=1 Tax=Platanthera guangdongensis TaxID=2320717 RepID=A0ABR2LBJ6_9ASPA